MPQFEWSTPGIHLEFRHGDDQPLTLTRIHGNGVDIRLSGSVPFVEVLAVGRGHTLANNRLVQTSIGKALRYRGHSEDGNRITLQLGEPGGIEATIRLRAGHGALRTETTIRNGGQSQVALTAVTTWAAGLGTPESLSGVPAGWDLIEGSSDWLGEGRWSRNPLRDVLPELREELTGHTPRSSIIRTATGTWSTNGHLPVAGVISREAGLAMLWQIENNGPWRWEIGEHVDDLYVAFSGPTDRDHQWSVPLGPGETFTTVPATLSFGRDLVEAARAMTDERRRNRSAHPDNTTPAIVFNDYMNTLDGDPTTEKLLPLIAAAASVGAEIFCIDAGWYSNSADWWDTVGEWKPSTTRFPNGIREVIDAITRHGMIPGLWLEPEVVGVNSASACDLPSDAFLQRQGQRVEEHDRYHLDLRHPATREHLDSVVDRLVAEFGIGYFKLDYNIDAGPGTDTGGQSAGQGLLEHNRAHLTWLEGILERHPDLILENCASGAMRMDAALLSRTQLQSTSDQQDPLRYPPIAAAAGMTMVPEQAANWAYPQPSYDAELNAFTLVTGLAGRFYLSGHLDQMSEPQLDLVGEAVKAARGLRDDLPVSTPIWPLGLPGWDDRWVATARTTPTRTITSIWDRGTGEGETTLEFLHLIDCHVRVDTIFPRHLPSWETRWNADTGTLTVHSAVTPPTARTFQLTVTAPSRKQPATSQPSVSPSTFKDSK